MSDTPPSPQPPLALIAEATKRAGVIWIAIQGQDRPRPAWHIWRAGPLSPGAAYVVTGPGEQPLPGLAGSGRVTVVGRDRPHNGEAQNGRLRGADSQEKWAWDRLGSTAGLALDAVRP